MKVLVVGLGEIGYHTSEHFTDKGLDVDGIDISKKAVERALNAHVIREEGVDFGDYDVIIVCVSTDDPNDELQPNLSAINAVTEIIKQQGKKGALVVIESTVSEGTCRRISEKLNPSNAHKFCVVHIPHRYYGPEKDIHGVWQKRVMGAVCPCGANRVVDIFHSKASIPLHIVSNVETAELSKIVENSYRFVQITFAEDLKVYCEKSGKNFDELRAACNTKWNVEIMKAKDGIGGHCLPKDTQMLVDLYRKAKLPLTLVEAAKKVDLSFKQSRK